MSQFPLVHFGLPIEQELINIVAIWPLGGIVLAGLLITRRRSWYWILPIAFFANLGACLLEGDSLALSLGFAVVDCTESLLIAYLLQRYACVDLIFERASYYFQYFLIISAGSALTAFLGAALVVSGFRQDYWQVWLSWWFAHGLGIALLTPLVLAFVPNESKKGKGAKYAGWSSIGFVSLQARLGILFFKSINWSISALIKSVIDSIKSSQVDLKKMVEGLLVAAAVQIAVGIIFLSSQEFLAESVLRSYIIFPFLIWFGLRFDRRLVTLLLTYVSVAAILGTLNGLGMFAERDFSVLERLQAVQLFLGVLVLVTLVPGALRREFVRASEKLVKSEADFRGLFEHASMGIFHFRPGDGFLMANPSLVAMLGYGSARELMEAERQPFTYSGQFEDWFEEKPTGPDGWVKRVTSFKCIDGSSLLVKLSMRKVTIADGGLAYFEGFVEDISEQKKAEDALLESTQEFRSIVEASPTAKHFYRLNEAGSLLLTGANPSAERLSGCSHIDLIDQPIELCLPGLADDDFIELCRQVALGKLGNQSFEKHISGETDQVGLNGYFEVQIFETRPGLIAIDLVDISARMLSEQVSRARLKLLELSDKNSLEQLLQATLDEAESLTGSQIGFYHFVEGDQKTLSLQTWSSRTLAHYCHAEGKGNHYPVDKAGVWVDCIKQRGPVIHNNYEALQHRQGLPAGHANLTRELVLPVMRGDKVVSLLGMGNKLSDYSAQDVTVISHLADLAWDITERKRAELSLQKSETLLNETQSIAKVGGWEFNLTSNRITWTQEVYQIYGLSSDFDPNNWDAQLSFYREADRDILSQAYGNAIGNGQAFDLELGLINNLKQELWVRTLASPVIENGKVVKVNGTIMDVSELKKTQAALAHSEEQLRFSMEASTDGVWDWRIKENTTYYSPAYTRMLGYTQEDFPAEHWIALVHPEDQLMVKRTDDGCRENWINVFEVEYRILSKALGWKWILSRGKTVSWDQDGLPERVVGTTVDITERKQAEDALKVANNNLEKQISANKLMQNLLLEQATHDGLTGLYNRRFMDDALQRELTRAHREADKVCVLMLDIDHFKLFNDNYGHEAGDQVLVALSSILHLNIRESDIACRYGGEEFVVILPGAGLADGLHRAEILRQEFNNCRVGPQALSGSISIGIAIYPEHGLNGEDLLRKADIALYAAKDAGRNCMRVFSYD